MLSGLLSKLHTNTYLNYMIESIALYYYVIMIAMYIADFNLRLIIC